MEGKDLRAAFSPSMNVEHQCSRSHPAIACAASISQVFMVERGIRVTWGKTEGKHLLGAQCTTLTAFPWKTGFKWEQIHKEATRTIVRTESLVSPVK